MGLGLSVNGKHVAGWSYSGFNSFRERVAKQVGIELRKMEGFSDVDKTILEREGWEAYRKAYEADMLGPKISWKTVKDPIKYLLHHSDCEGTIGPKRCGLIADRLEEIIKEWPDCQKLKVDPFWQEKGYSAEMDWRDYDKEQALGLIAGMREAAKIGKPLEFH
jgi:hypothetical protein